MCYCHVYFHTRFRQRGNFFPFRRAVPCKEQCSSKTPIHYLVRGGGAVIKRHRGAVLTSLPPPPKTTRLQCWQADRRPSPPSTGHWFRFTGTAAAPVSLPPDRCDTRKRLARRHGLRFSGGVCDHAPFSSPAFLRPSRYRAPWQRISGWSALPPCGPYLASGCGPRLRPLPSFVNKGVWQAGRSPAPMFP